MRLLINLVLNDLFAGSIAYPVSAFSFGTHPPPALPRLLHQQIRASSDHPLVSGLPFPSIDDSEDTYTWKVLDADDSTTVMDDLDGQIGQQIEFTPTMTDSGSVFGVSVIRSDSSGTELSSSKYVRLGCKHFNLVYA